jgi:hypothetical protein
VRVAFVPGVGGHQELVLALGVVQRVVQAGDHPRRVAERRMRSDVLDALAVDEDLAAVLQRLQVFLAGLRLRYFHLTDSLGLGGEGLLLFLQSAPSSTIALLDKQTLVRLSNEIGARQGRA